MPKSCSDVALSEIICPSFPIIISYRFPYCKSRVIYRVLATNERHPLIENRSEDLSLHVIQNFISIDF